MVERERTENFRDKKREEARLLLVLTLRRVLGDGKLANSVMGLLANFQG